MSNWQKRHIVIFEPIYRRKYYKKSYDFFFVQRLSKHLCINDISLWRYFASKVACWLENINAICPSTRHNSVLKKQLYTFFFFFYTSNSRVYYKKIFGPTDRHIRLFHHYEKKISTPPPPNIESKKFFSLTPWLFLRFLWTFFF